MGNGISGDEEAEDDQIDPGKLREVLRTTPGWIQDDSTRCQIWVFLLLGMKLVGDDVEIPKWLNENSTASSRRSNKISVEDHRTILADVKRTRRYIPLFQLEETQRSIEVLLTRFCVQRETSYKQGMNELLAPFYMLKSPPLPEELVYKLFEAFVKRYVEVFLLDDDFRCLQRAFGLFDLLLHFHDPGLAVHLNQNGFTPELYATPWIITLFSRQLEIELVYRLWDVLLGVDDPNFIFFLMLVLITSRHADLMLKDEENLPEVIQHLKVDSAEELDQVISSAFRAQEFTPASFQKVLRSLPLQTLQARARMQSLRRATSRTPDGSVSPPRDSKDKDTPLRVRSMSSADVSLARSPVMRERRKSHLPPRSPISPWTNRKQSPSMLQAYSADNNQGMGSNGGFFFCEAVGCVSMDTRELLRSLRPPTPIPTPTPAISSPLIQYVVLDVRLDQDFTNSGAGELAKSYRLPQEFLNREEELEKWLQHFDGTSGCHICLIDSHPEVYRNIGNNFFMNIFNNNEKNPNQPYQHAMRMASLLQARGFPHITILEGGFDSLLLEVIREEGEAEPVILNHNPQRWVKSLKSRGHTEILTYLPSDYGKLSDQSGRLERTPSPANTMRKHASARKFESIHNPSPLKRVMSSSGYMDKVSGGLRKLQIQTHSPSSLRNSFSQPRHDRSKSTCDAPSQSPYSPKSRKQVYNLLNNIQEGQTVQNSQNITDQELYKMALQRAEIRGHKVAAVLLNRKLKGADPNWGTMNAHLENSDGGSDRAPKSTPTDPFGSEQSSYDSSESDHELRSPAKIDAVLPGPKDQPRFQRPPAPTRPAASSQLLGAPMGPRMPPTLTSVNKKIRSITATGLPAVPYSERTPSPITFADDNVHRASFRAFRPSDTEWQAWKPEGVDRPTKSASSLDLHNQGMIEDVILDAKGRGHMTVARVLQQRTNATKN